MKVIQTADLRPDTPLSSMEREWVYNGLDCTVTLEVLHALLPQLDNVSAGTYAFSRALQAPVLEMTVRGLLVDQNRRMQVLTHIREEIQRLSDNLDRIVRDGIGTSANWRSPKQLAVLLYDVMQLPAKRKRNANGQLVPTTDRNALEHLTQYFIAEPICNHLLALRELDKKRQFLEQNVDADGRLRTNFNIAGTNTGRLASAISDFGTGGNLQNVDRELRSVCVADRGMKFANLDLEQGDARNVGAICWNYFVDEFGEDYAGSYLNACESGDLHTTVCRMAWLNLPWIDDKAKNREVAEQIAYRQDSYRQLAKKLGHGCLTEDHEVLTPAGWTSIKNTPPVIMQWRTGASSFTEVQEWTRVNYTGELQSFEGTSISALMTHDHRVPFYKDQGGILHVNPAEKGPGKLMPLGEGYAGGDVIIPARLIAAHMADGHQETNWSAFHFHKYRKFQRLKYLCDKYGIEYKMQGKDKIRVKGVYPKRPGAFMFQWTKECLEDFLDELQHWDGHIGKSSISISSVKKEDLEWYQTFGRLLGKGGNISKPYTSGFGSTVYRLQQNNRRYVHGPSIKHTKHAVENVPVYCPTVSTGYFYVRRNGKIFVTGNTNYYGLPPTMAKHTKVEQRVIEEFQRAYFGAFPVIGSFNRNDFTTPHWHNRVRMLLREDHAITTLLGRRRSFFGRPQDDETLRAAIAYEPQSLTADEIDTGLIRLFRANRVQLLVQVHDSVLIQFPEEQENEIVPWALEKLKTRIQLAKGREFIVPTEAKVGWNWGDYSSSNPDGLMKWKGGDMRKRTEQPAGLSIHRL